MKRIFALIIVIIMLAILMVIILNQKEEPGNKINILDSLHSGNYLYLADSMSIDCSFIQPSYSLIFRGEGEIEMEFKDSLKITTDIPMNEAAKIFLDCLKDEYLFRIIELKDSLRYWKNKTEKPNKERVMAKLEMENPDYIQKYKADVFANLIYSIAYCLYQDGKYDEAYKMLFRLTLSYENGNKKKLPELFIAAVYAGQGHCLMQIWNQKEILCDNSHKYTLKQNKYRDIYSIKLKNNYVEEK